MQRRPEEGEDQGPRGQLCPPPPGPTASLLPSPCPAHSCKSEGHFCPYCAGRMPRPPLGYISEAPSVLALPPAGPHSPGLVGAGILVQKRAEHERRTSLPGDPGPGHVHIEGPQGCQAYGQKRNCINQDTFMKPGLGCTSHYSIRSCGVIVPVSQIRKLSSPRTFFPQGKRTGCQCVCLRASEPLLSPAPPVAGSLL